MIKGKRRIELSPESVLNMISAYDLFRFYMPSRDWKPNVVTCSPFHKDDNPSFLIGDRGGGGLHFVDFAQPDKRGGPIDFVMCRYGLDLNEALRKIDSDFGLGFTSNTNVGKYKEIVSEYKQPESAGKRYSLIQVVTRKFTNLDLKYWSEYYQSEDDLRANNIYSIKEVYLNRQRYAIAEDLRFGYLYPSGYWKIYVPFSKRKRGKWISNVPITILDGGENIIDCCTAFITKSKKDKMVLQKLYPHVLSTQNESLACYSVDNVNFIKSNSKNQIVMYDSDPPGVLASKEITKLFGFGYCNVPRNYLSEGIKDWADLAKNYGLKVIENVLKDKNIY